MKKVIIIFIALVVVAGAVFAGLKLTGVLGESGSKNVLTEALEKIQEKVEDVDILSEEESFVGSMKDLLTKGDNLKCTYSSKEEGVDTSGTIYIADNHVHTEILITQEGESDIQMDMVLLDEWSYVWNSAQTSGMKARVSSLEGGEDFNASEDVFELEEEFDMVCIPWIKDNSEFNVPDGIEFIDYTDLVEDMEGYTQEEFEDEIVEESYDAITQLCEMCESAPTQELKDQCKIDADCDSL